MRCGALQLVVCCFVGPGSLFVRSRQECPGTSQATRGAQSLSTGDTTFPDTALLLCGQRVRRFLGNVHFFKSWKKGAGQPKKLGHMPRPACGRRPASLRPRGGCESQALGHRAPARFTLGRGSQAFFCPPTLSFRPQGWSWGPTLVPHVSSWKGLSTKTGERARGVGGPGPGSQTLACSGQGQWCDHHFVPGRGRVPGWFVDKVLRAGWKHCERLAEHGLGTAGARPQGPTSDPVAAGGHKAAM